MASLMEDLLDVLEKEEQQYKELSELGETKKEVIVAAKIRYLPIWQLFWEKIRKR